jgi:hypothetical protein
MLPPAMKIVGYVLTLLLADMPLTLSESGLAYLADTTSKTDFMMKVAMLS